jgi:hypothetical protein
MEYGRRSLITGSSTSCPVLEKLMLAIACCVDNDVYVAAGFNYSLVRVRVRVTLRLTVGQSVCLGVEPHPGLMTRCLLTL